MVFDPTVGYSPGMNFIAAMILMHVPNEVLALNIFMKVLEKDNWRRIFLNSTPKLFEISEELQVRLKAEDQELYNFLIDNEIVMEIVLSSSLMSLFANTTNFSVTTHIFNCFILEGESYIIDLLLNIYKSFRFSIMNFKE